MAYPAPVGAGVLTGTEITQLGYVSLANYLKNKPIDQVAQQRPLLKALMAKKRPWGGGVGATGGRMIVEQVRMQYGNGDPSAFTGSAFKWFGDTGTNVSDTLNFNTRDPVRQVFYPWNSAHDGFQFSEDYLLGNGILINDSQSPKNSSDASLVQLTNIFNEAMDVLRLGFEEMMDISLHLDGQWTVGSAPTANATINGLDFLVNFDPTTGTVGGIPRATNAWFQNQWDFGRGLNTVGAGPAPYAHADLLAAMHKMWRYCQKNGGSPNFILAGEDFIKGYELASVNGSSAAMSRYAVQPSASDRPWNVDASLEIKDSGTFTGMFFQGVPIFWDPTFSDCELIDGGVSQNKTVPWAKRCYFLNMNHLSLRPIEGNDMIARKPPREHNKLVYYWGLTWRGALTMNRANCHGVIAASGA